MTEGSKKVFNFLKGNEGQKLTVHNIADALDVSLSTVIGSVNGLVKKGLAEREEVEVPGVEEGKTVKIKYIHLTDDGKVYDPEKEEAAKAAEKAMKKGVKAE